MACNPFDNEEARDSLFDFEQAIILDFWLESFWELEMITSEQLQLGMNLEERVVEPSVPELEGQVNFACGSWDGPLNTSLLKIRQLMKPSWCLNPNAVLIWDLTAEVELEGNNDET